MRLLKNYGRLCQLQADLKIGEHISPVVLEDVDCCVGMPRNEI